jgi:hypothetical protein
VASHPPFADAGHTGTRVSPEWVGVGVGRSGAQEGKQRSRCNAVRHGLTAETVIGALEDAEDYRAFEGTIIADYDAQSAVEREASKNRVLRPFERKVRALQ